MNGKFFRNGIVMLVLVVGTVVLLAAVLITPSTSSSDTQYSDFLKDVSAGSVKTVRPVDDEDEEGIDEPDDDLAEGAVVHVEAASPSDAAGIER